MLRTSTYRDVRYGPLPAHLCDLILHNDPKPRPTIMLVHGGGWSAGDKSAYASKAKHYAAIGYHVCAINYRLALDTDPSTHWPAQLEDVTTAIRWLRSMSWCSRICVMGDSAGAHLALMLGTTNDRPSLIVDMYGPTDLSMMAPQLAQLPLFAHHAATPDASPLERIGDCFPPTLIVHGTKDATVSYQQSEELAKVLSHWNVEHDFITFDGGHGLADLGWWRELLIELRVMWWVWRRL